MSQTRSQDQSSQNDSFVCPITNKTTMRARGVRLSNGCTYSKSGLKQAIKYQNYFPQTLPGSDQYLMQSDINIARSAISDTNKAAAIGFLIGSVIAAAILTALFIAALPVGVSFSFFLVAAVKIAVISAISGLVSACFAWGVDKLVESYTIPSVFPLSPNINYPSANLNVPSSTYYVTSGLNYGYRPTYIPPISPVYLPPSNLGGYRSTGSSMPMSMPSSNPGGYHSTGGDGSMSMPSSNPGGYHSTGGGGPISMPSSNPGGYHSTGSSAPSMPTSNAGGYHSSSSVGSHRV
jgi:uncharacterized membrane protein YgcG